MRAEALIAQINAGAYDDHLAAIEAAIQNRRRFGVREFNIDDRVVVTANVSPKYLKGMQGTVVSLKTKNVVVKFDESRGRFRAGVPITCPPSIIDRVAA